MTTEPNPAPVSQMAREAAEAERRFAQEAPSTAIAIEGVLALYRFDTEEDRSRAHEALRVWNTRTQSTRIAELEEALRRIENAPTIWDGGSIQWCRNAASRVLSKGED